MSGLAKRRRTRLVLGSMALLALSAGLLGYAFRDGIQFFRTPTEVTGSPPDGREIFRIGGIVEPGSVEREGSEIRFRITDGAASVAVVFVGITPDLFREGEGVIATGRLVGGRVEASQVLARHDEEYTPRELAGMSL